MTPEEELNRYLLRARLMLEEHCLLSRGDGPSLLEAFVSQEPTGEPLTLDALQNDLEHVYDLIGE
jgi:hypothetical protein